MLNFVKRGEWILCHSPLYSEFHPYNEPGLLNTDIGLTAFTSL